MRGERNMTDLGTALAGRQRAYDFLRDMIRQGASLEVAARKIGYRPSEAGALLRNGPDIPKQAPLPISGSDLPPSNPPKHPGPTPETTERRQRLLSMLVDIAKLGAPMPSNEALGEMLGTKPVNARDDLAALCASGSIVIDRQSSFRRACVQGRWTGWTKPRRRP